MNMMNVSGNDALKQAKVALRKKVREALAKLSHEQIAEWSRAITQRILELNEYQQAKTVMVYLSMMGEHGTDELIRHAMAAGKSVCAPKVMWQTGRMYPMRLTSLEAVEVDDHGIRTPISDEQCPVDQCDFILVPGLAFDARGRRLGRGGGFYDKLLSRTDVRAAKVAAAFDLQIVESLPVDVHDQPVDVIVTPSRQMRFVRKSQMFVEDAKAPRRDTCLGVDF
jgi:5-formyltetrahydrofolate cyclo-ligase